MPTSVRLDAETDALLRRCAAASGRSRSEIVREAIVRFVAQEGRPPASTVYDMIADLVGVESGGDPTLSQRTGQVFRERLAVRHK